ALLPVRHLVAGHRLHLHVEGEEVVAALDAVIDHLVEEVLDLDPLAEQAPLHIGERGYDRVDRARLALLAEVVEREHAGGPAGTAGPLNAHGAIRAITAAATRTLVRGDLVLLERLHRALVLVLRRDQVPDAEDQRQQNRNRR